MSKTVDLTGQRFGRWEILRKTESFRRKDGKTESQYVCKCDCGTVKVRKAKDILGNSISCGCFRSEYMRNKRTTHGMTDSRLFNIWDSMKQRCRIDNENHKHWAGKGIAVCDEWLGEKGFENFQKWAVENGYADNLTIDRKDTNGNYEPNNCRWVDYYIQNNNSANNVRIECFGETKTIAEWAREYDLAYQTLYSRLKNGWNVERALLTRPKER